MHSFIHSFIHPAISLVLLLCARGCARHWDTAESKTAGLVAGHNPSSRCASKRGHPTQPVTSSPSAWWWAYNALSTPSPWTLLTTPRPLPWVSIVPSQGPGATRAPSASHIQNQTSSPLSARDKSSTITRQSPWLPRAKLPFASSAQIARGISECGLTTSLSFTPPGSPLPTR